MVVRLKDLDKGQLESVDRATILLHHINLEPYVVVSTTDKAIYVDGWISNETPLSLYDMPPVLNLNNCICIEKDDMLELKDWMVII